MMMRKKVEHSNAHNNKTIIHFAWDFALLMPINDKGFMWIELGTEAGLRASHSYEIEHLATKVVVFLKSWAIGVFVRVLFIVLKSVCF